jgi:hypothetical protein
VIDFVRHARRCRFRRLASRLADPKSWEPRLSDVSSDPSNDRPVGGAVGGGDLFRAATKAEGPDEDRPVVDDSQAAMERLRMPFDVSRPDRMAS